MCYVVGSTVPRIALGEKLQKGYEHAWENSLVNYSAAHAQGTEALAVVVTIVPESNVISLYGGGHCMQLYVARGYPCVVVYYVAGLLECVPSYEIILYSGTIYECTIYEVQVTQHRILRISLLFLPAVVSC